MCLSCYDRYVLPSLLDLACNLTPIKRQREKIVPRAYGDVLEIGIGTALNASFYDKAKVNRLVGVDPAFQMQQRARKRLEQANLKVEVIGIEAERLPLAESSFDCVVCTYTLCSIPEPGKALAEVRRVLKPGGFLLFSEHGMAPDASVRAWQARIQPLWGRLAGGCKLGLDIPALLQKAGFDGKIESRYIAGPRFSSYHYWGEASVIR